MSRGRVVQLSEWLFDFLKSHPVLKLVGLLWIVVTSVWIPVDALRRERGEAQRGGWDYVPSVRLLLQGPQCKLVNTGNRPIAEVTLQWKEFYVDATDCRQGIAMTFQTRPAFAGLHVSDGAFGIHAA